MLNCIKINFIQWCRHKRLAWTDGWYAPRTYGHVLLLPLSGLYRIAIALRYGYYRYIKRLYTCPIPVIVVGNLTVGGTGKTPFVMALVNHLKCRGFRPGMISRGYGGKTGKRPCIVSSSSSVCWVGDEAILLVKRTQAPLVVCADRPRALQTLLAHFDCNVVISDDGLQHYALRRDIEIAVIDGERVFGNGYCLPAGPLREPVKRLCRVDAMVVNGGPSEVSLPYNLSAFPVHRMTLGVVSIEQINQPSHRLRLADCQGRVVHAVGGLGNPSRFFEYLKSQGMVVRAHPFPDHYVFHESDFIFDDEHIIVMTEKDAIKCQHFANDRLFCIAVEACLPRALQDRLLHKIQQSLR